MNPISHWEIQFFCQSWEGCGEVTRESKGRRSVSVGGMDYGHGGLNFDPAIGQFGC